MIILLYLFLSFLYSFENDNLSNIDSVEFKSDYAYYNHINGTIELSSDVVINMRDMNENVLSVIKGENAFIDVSSYTLIMKSSFTLETSSLTLNSISGYYDFKKDSAIFNNAVVYYENFVVKGKVIEKNNDKYIYKRSNMTTCNLEPPHYHISSYRTVFVPGKYFLSYNNIFYLGKMPIFYLPLMYKPLGEGTPVMSQFYPGYDGRNGFYIKSNYTYKFSRYIKTKLFIDYYSKKGFGFGGEVYDYNPSYIKLDLSYYRIDEKDSKVFWGANGGIWYRVYQKDNKEVYFQSFARDLSDPDFNNKYFRSNPFSISDDKQWNFSTTYKMPYSYLRINLKKYYIRSNDTFKENLSYMPKIEYQFLTKQIARTPFNHSFYVSFENSNYNDTDYTKKINYSHTLSNSINIFKDLSLYNSLGYLAYIEFSTISQMSDTFVSRYTYTSSLRLSTLSNSYQVSYSGIFRTKNRQFILDSKSSDKGIEKSALDFDITLFSMIERYSRISWSYDLKSYTYNKDFIHRISPISFESYSSKNNYSIYFKDIYDLNRGNQAVILHMSSSYEKNYLDVGVANYSQNRDRIVVSNRLGYYPVKRYGWYGEFILRYYFDIDSNDMGFKIFEKGFVLNKEFHDFRTRFVFKNRKNVNEFFFYITMKMNDRYKNDNIDREVNEYFKPWRKFDEERDY